MLVTNIRNSTFNYKKLGKGYWNSWNTEKKKMEKCGQRL